MKKEENKISAVEQQLVKTMKALDLDMCMMTLFILCSPKKGIEADLEKTSKTLEKFRTAVDKDVADDNATTSSVVINSGKKLISDLDSLRKKIDKPEDNILELLSKAQKLTNEVIA